MVEEIKSMTTWNEAYKWLAKHGYGLTQIEQQKVLWHSSKKSPEPVTAPEPVKISEPVVTAEVTPVVVRTAVKPAVKK